MKTVDRNVCGSSSGTFAVSFFDHSLSQDMQHCLWTGWLQLDGGQRFLSHRTEPSRQTHTAHGSDASSHVSPLARSRPSYRQPARDMRQIENMIKLEKVQFRMWLNNCVKLAEVFCCNIWHNVLDPHIQIALSLCYNILAGLRNCTFAGPAALLCDGVRTWSKGAGLALTMNCPIGAGTWSTVVSWVVETLSVSVGLLFVHTIRWRSWGNISGKNQLHASTIQLPNWCCVWSSKAKKQTQQ